MMRNLLFIISIIFLSACSSIRYIDIDAYRPAEITFPANVEKVMIVNNAVPQPSDRGYSYKVFDIEQDTARAMVDSALFDFTHSLGKKLVEVDYFKDVLFLSEPIRSDSDFLVEKRLTREQVIQLCEENDVDAIITLESLLFNTNKEVSLIHGYLYNLSVKVEAKGVLRAYLPERDSPMTSILLSDSLIVSDNEAYLEILYRDFPSTEEVIRYAGTTFGEKSFVNFVPYWQQDMRWYYTAGNTAWRMATAYASTGKWTLAKEQWQGIYENTNRTSVKAKSASNVALTLELSGEISEAYDWAQKSAELFKDYEGEGSDVYKRQDIYAKMLKERLLDENRLIRQIRR
jgi:hypothetical protein